MPYLLNRTLIHLKLVQGYIIVAWIYCMRSLPNHGAFSLPVIITHSFS